MEMYNERKPPEQPPCNECMVEVLDENKVALDIFFITRNQLIMGFDGPIDIMHEPIHSAMKLFSVHDKKACFKKILTMSYDWLWKIRNR